MVTLIFTALVSAILFLLGTNSPSQPDQKQLISYQDLLLEHSNTSILALNASNTALPTPSAALAANISTIGNATSKLVNSKAWLDSAAVASNFRAVNYLVGNNTDFAPL